MASDTHNMHDMHDMHDTYGPRRDSARTAEYQDAEESLRQTIALTRQVYNQFKSGTLRVTAAEAASMDTLLQELVLQAAAIGGRIREQQASDASGHF
jgi:hypothetical protein